MLRSLLRNLTHNKVRKRTVSQLIDCSHCYLDQAQVQGETVLGSHSTFELMTGRSLSFLINEQLSGSGTGLRFPWTR